MRIRNIEMVHHGDTHIIGTTIELVEVTVEEYDTLEKKCKADVPVVIEDETKIEAMDMTIRGVDDYTERRINELVDGLRLLAKMSEEDIVGLLGLSCQSVSEDMLKMSARVDELQRLRKECGLKEVKE